MKNKGLNTIIFLTIAVILFAGIISCGGADITGSGRSYSSENTGNNTNSGDNTPSSPDDDTTILPDDNPSDYYRLRVPFGVGGDGYTNVSYKDTNKLKQLWLDQINRKAVNDGRVFAIRNRANDGNENNFQSRRSHGQYSAYDYYYFNDSGDIIWKEDNTTIKKFMGAIITGYRDVSKEMGAKNIWLDNSMAIKKYTWREKGIYTVGAIYANALTTEQARAKYHGDNRFKEGVFEFITARHYVETFNNGAVYANNVFERQYINPGFIEVLVMYDYDNLGHSGSAGVHSYYAYYGIYNYYREYANHPGIYFTPENMPYMTNHNIYLGQRPEYTTTQLTHSTAFTDSGRWWSFLFMPSMDR
ncbi:hypothetical protein [Brachyspira sp.]|uniref:hypothetical protein n=1 Tax=Brachyspira sp. TaxID=1977261 RepID=UPI003D7D1B27